MKAVYRNRFLRMIVLVDLLVTVYWLGRWYGTVQADEANQAELAAMQKARA
jgi:hypothetical protein